MGTDFNAAANVCVQQVKSDQWRAFIWPGREPGAASRSRRRQLPPFQERFITYHFKYKRAQWSRLESGLRHRPEDVAPTDGWNG